jgi:uncharacterized membrane protein
MTKSSHTQHKSKKDTVLNQHHRRMNPKTIVMGVAIVLITVAVTYFITGTGQGRPQSASIAQASATNATTPGANEVHYPVSLFGDGQARYYSHQANGMTIRYFVLKSSDGIIRAAFDACDVCWPAGKGYYQDGDDMVCRNCGRRFASALVNEVEGGCNPAPLTRSVEKDQLIIKVDDILEGQTYFKGV